MPGLDLFKFAPFFFFNLGFERFFSKLHSIQITILSLCIKFKVFVFFFDESIILRE